MDTLFQNVWSASVYGSIVIIAVMLLRLALKKVPKKYICLLWLLAAIRLLMPFQIRSPLSLQPELNTAVHTQSEADTWQENAVQSPILSENNNGQAHDSMVNADHSSSTVLRINDWISTVPYAWLIGSIVMLFYSAISYLRLRQRVHCAVILYEGVWICPRLRTSFILGLFRPQIYLDPGLSETQLEFVLRHERSHIRRGDQWWKLLGFVTLAIHWFNPFAWLAYLFLCRDLEMACDESVVAGMNVTERKAYSSALLSCSISHHTIAACPVAFGETSVKARIKNVLNYKKPKFWLILISIIAIVAVGICLLTNPAGMTDEEVLSSLYSQLEALQNQESIYLRLTMRFEGGIEDIISQQQEFRMNGDDWYRTFEYTTSEGSFTTVYLQKDGIQYACEYGDIEGFTNRDWQEIPEQNYADLPTILTKDWTQLEVLEISHGASGKYSIIIQDDYSGSIHDTVNSYYYTFTLDNNGNLSGISSYSDIEMYVEYFDKESIRESKTHTIFEFWEPDNDLLSQLITDALGE